MMNKIIPALFVFSFVFLLIPQNSFCHTVSSGFRIENKTRETLFDINAEISEKEVKNKYMTTKVTLINFGEPGEVNTTVNYTVLDSYGREVYRETDKVSVLTQKQYLKTFDTGDWEDGEYTVVMDLEYRGQIEPAKTEATFEVNRKSNSMETLFVFLIAFLAVLLVAYWKRDWVARIVPFW